MGKLKICFICAIVFLLFFFTLKPPFAVSPEDFSCVLNSFQSEGIKSKVDVGFIPIDVAVNKEINKIYVSNFGDNTVSVIGGSDNSVISTISVGNSPYGIAVNQKTNKIYVANQIDNTVSVIDGSTDIVVITISVEAKPIQLALNSNTNKVYVVNQDSNTVSVIDGLNDTLISSIAVGETPFGIEINTKTNKIYVSNSASNSISVIDGVTDTVTKTIENLGDGTYGVTIDEENNKVYAFSLKGEELLGRGFLFKIDGATDTIIESFIIGSNGTDIAFHPATKKIYVTHTFNGTIDGYDEKKEQLLCVITEVDSPSGIAINPKSNLIYVCNNDLSSVTILKDTEIKDNKKDDEPKDEPVPEIVNEIKRSLNDLREIQKNLKQASKFARPTAARLGALVNKLSKVLDATQERCSSLIGNIVDNFESIIPMLESRSCSETKSRRCIPQDTVDEFILDLEEKLEVVNSIIETDDNENSILDVCE